MLEFALFMLIILGFMGGAGFLYVLLTRLTRRVGDGEDLNLSLLREELDSVSAQLARVEEEFEFYKKLNAPEQTDPEKSLPGPEDPIRQHAEGATSQKESLS